MSIKRTKKNIDTKLEDKPQVCVYIGPSLRGIITKGQVFRGDKQTALASLVPAARKYPGIANLIVSGEQLAGARFEVKREGSLLNKKYTMLARAGSNKEDKT